MAADPTTDRDVPAHVRAGNKLLEVAETVVYVGIAALLVVIAITVIGVTAVNVPSMVGTDFDGTQSAALELLDSLLLVFIVVVLLYAVRATIAERQLVAEPFLLVGVIASIKEIVVLSVKAADLVGEPSSPTPHGRSACSAGSSWPWGSPLAAAAREREPDETDDDHPVVEKAQA